MFTNKPVEKEMTPETIADRDADYVKRGLLPPPPVPENADEEKPKADKQ